VTSRNTSPPSNFRAYSPQISVDSRPQPDIPASNVYDDETQVVYLNGFQDKTPEYLWCLVRPKVVFATDTSLTTEQLSWLVAMPDDQRVRYS
jgi:hypothetical protein